MAAPKGNNFYKLVRKPTGRPKKYTPNSLWKVAVKYFEWIEKNPLWEEKTFANATTKKVAKMRAMTELSFCLFAGITRETWRLYKSGDPGYQDFSDTCEHISDIIYTQKFEGAAADLFNGNIIARHLGLKESTELTGKDGKPLIPKPRLNLDHLSVEDLERIIDKSKNGR